jgi:hypothetical protein
MRTIWYSSICLIIFCFSISFATAQEKKPTKRDTAYAEIKKFKESTLIVSLTSNYKKVQALQKLANSTELEKNKKERIRDQIATTLAETAYENKLIYQAFEKYYKFSKVLFMYDTATVALTKEERKIGLFLDENLVIDQSLKLQTEDFYILKFASTDPSTTAAADAMIITDQYLENLKRPFPYAIKMTSFSFVMDSMFSPKEAFEKNINSRVRKLARQLNAFYEKAIEE